MDKQLTLDLILAGSGILLFVAIWLLIKSEEFKGLTNDISKKETGNE